MDDPLPCVPYIDRNCVAIPFESKLVADRMQVKRFERNFLRLPPESTDFVPEV